MTTSYSPARAIIDLAALKRNYASLGESGRLMAVIKSDAYGHGLLPVAKTLTQCGCAHFAVGTLSEALTLRKEGFAQEILPLLGLLSVEEWRKAREAQVLPLLRDFADIDAAASCGITDCAIKLESGMGRLGFAARDLPALLAALAAQPKLKPTLLLSHLACADDEQEDAYNAQQRDIFEAVYAELVARYPGIRRSLGNSAGTLRGLDCDLLRPGLALYGISPLRTKEVVGFPEPEQLTRADTQASPPLRSCGNKAKDYETKLEPVLSLYAPILQVRELEPGQSLSYGRIFTASKPMRVAVVGIGYAEGLARNLSGRFAMLVHGQRAPQIGRICMGMAIIDVSAIPKASPGDRAWIIGGQAAPGQSAPTAQELAQILGTIPYELLCLMGRLNQREYQG